MPIELYTHYPTGNPVTMMATKLSKETGILESVVVQHVNVMFEQGRRYDDYDSVLAELNEVRHCFYFPHELL